MASIRVVTAPPGEAPADIRNAWVGLELPVRRCRAGRYLGSGVLSGPRSVYETLFDLLAWRLTIYRGFAVPSLAAIEILERSNPAAALWWRENAPQMTKPWRHFVFATECCELMR